MAEEMFERLLRETTMAEENFPEETVEEPEMVEGDLPRETYDRLEGMVDQRDLEAMKKAVVEIAMDLLHEGFEGSDVINYLTGHLTANVDAVEDTLRSDKEEAPASAEGEEECVKPPYESKTNEDQQPPKGPDKSPEMKGKDPQHSNVNETSIEFMRMAIQALAEKGTDEEIEAAFNLLPTDVVKGTSREIGDEPEAGEEECIIRP